MPCADGCAPVASVVPTASTNSAKNTPDARINNYTRLQPSLAKIGVQLDTRTVTSLVREERGAATRLLSSLRMNLDAMVRDVEKAKVGTRLGQTAMSARTVPSLGVAESFRRAGAFNTARSGYDSQIARQFETTLRVNEDRPNLVMEQAHVARFAQEKYRHQERVVADHVAKKEEMLRELRDRRVLAAAENATLDGRWDRSVRSGTVEEPDVCIVEHKGLDDAVRTVL